MDIDRNPNRFAIIALCLVIFSFGVYVGVAFTTAHVKAVIECDTDSDCLAKNGCGGYADPCEMEAK